MRLGAIGAVLSATPGTWWAVKSTNGLSGVTEFGLKGEFAFCALNAASKERALLLQVFHLLEREDLKVGAVPHGRLGQQVHGDGIIGVQESRASGMGRIQLEITRQLVSDGDKATRWEADFPYRIVARPIFMLRVNSIAIAVYKRLAQRCVNIGDCRGGQIARISIGRLTGSEANIHGGSSARNAARNGMEVGRFSEFRGCCHTSCICTEYGVKE